MAANDKPVFELVPHIGKVVISTANTHLDGTGTLGTLIIGTTNGTRISRITIQALGTTTAGMIRIFVKDGTNYFLWKEIQVLATTPSATVKAFNYTLELFGEMAIVLPYGYSLEVSTELAESFAITCKGGDL